MWFTENAWPPIILFVGAALICVHYWRQTGRTVLVFAGLVMFLAAVGVYFLERQIVTDVEKVQIRIFDLVHLVVKQTNSEPRDVRPVLAMLEPGNDALRLKVQPALNVVRVSDANVRDLNVQPAGEGRIEATLRVNAKINLNLAASPVGDIGYQSSRWRMVWVYVGEDWKLNDLQRLHQLKDEVIPMMSIE